MKSTNIATSTTGLHPFKSCDSELFNGYNLVSLAAIFFDFMAIFKNRCISLNRDENKTKIVNSLTESFIHSRHWTKEMRHCPCEIYVNDS